MGGADLPGLDDLSTDDDEHDQVHIVTIHTVYISVSLCSWMTSLKKLNLAVLLNYHLKWL